MTSQTARTRLVLVVMCAGYFLVLLDVTIVNVALPSIAAAFGATVTGLQWVVDAYAIVFATLMLAAGAIGDAHGHKPVVLAGLAVFGLASLVCGLAPSIAVLLAGRAVQGAGAALMLPGTLAVIAHVFPDPADQARAIGIWAGIGSLALAAGPAAGGALTGLLGWRAVFYVNVPVAVVALLVAVRVVPDTAAVPLRVDVPGIVLGAATLALLTLALTTSDGLAAALALAAVVAFVVVERRSADPMLPLALFRRPGFAAANAIAGAMNLATLGALFVLTLYLQDVRRDSALTAGLELLPLFAPLAVLAPLGGRLTARLGPRPPMTIGLVLAAAGLGLLARPTASSSYVTLLPALLLWGTGLSLLTPAVVAAAVGSVPSDRAGLASAVNNTARQAGGVIGIAAFGALAGHGLVDGLHAVALIAASLLVAGAIAAVTFMRAPAHYAPPAARTRSGRLADGPG